MKFTRTIAVFAAGCVCYALMAACSTTGDSSASSNTTTGGGQRPGNASGGGGSSQSNSTTGAGIGGREAGGGGAGGSPLDETTSGSRLKRMFDRADDGTTELELTWIPWEIPNRATNNAQKPTVRWWDSERNETCAFQLAADGKTRCLPDVPIGFILYTDSHCTQLAIGVGQSQPGCQQEKPRYAVSIDTTGTCQSEKVGFPPIHVAAVGELLGFQQCAFSGPSCQQGCYEPGMVFYAVGAEIDPSQFVAGMPATDP